MENKIGKYFKYAIGEILLVVIGILIALQINNWNEQKKASVYEQMMLTEVRNALAHDVEFFKNHLIGNRLNRILKASTFFENYLISNSINKDSLNYHFSGLGTGLQVTYNKGPFEALKSTGIDRINNDSLRNMIIDLYEFKLPRYTGLIKIYIDRFMTKAEVLEDQLRDNLLYEVQSGMVVYHANRIKAIDLKTNQAFLNLLSLSSNSSKSVAGIFNYIIPEMEYLINELDKELSKPQ